jgi:hypothetical protein
MLDGARLRLNHCYGNCPHETNMRFRLDCHGDNANRHAGAQQPPPARQDPATANKPAVARPATAKGPAMDGIWSGMLTQVAGGGATQGGSESKYAVELTINGEGSRVQLSRAGMPRKIKTNRHIAELRIFCGSNHPWSRCRCPDGSVTLTRSGENLGVEWFGIFIFKDELILASGTGTRKPAQ